MNQVVDIFPLPIYCEKYNLHEEVKKILHDVKNKCEINRSGVNENLIHYHSNKHSILKENKLFEFKEWCEKICKYYTENHLGYVISDKMIVTDSWMNVCNSGGHQYYHTHTNCFVSATYYVNYDSKKHAPLTFLKPNFSDGYNISLDTNENYVKNNSIDFYPEEGCIIMWPSYLKHGYENNLSDNRMTISMNFMPSEVKHGPHSFKVMPV